MAANMQKIKLLKLYELLRKETDESHPISRVELCRRLNEMGISSNVRTLSLDIEVMPDKSIRQAFGPCNTQLYGDEKKAFDKWCKALGLGEKEYYGAAVHEEVCFNPKMAEMLKQFEREHPEEKEAWLKENESIAKIIAA